MKKLITSICLFCALTGFSQYTYETNVLVETIAGSGFAGYLDGVRFETMFNTPSTIAVDSKTNVFVYDSANYRVRKITADGQVTTFAGSGVSGNDDGLGTNASFIPGITCMTIDRNDNLYLGQQNRIRKITTNGMVTLYAGDPLRGGIFADGHRTNALFGNIFGLAFDAAGKLYVVDAANYRIRVIGLDDMVTTYAGSGNSEIQDGTGIFSSFKWPVSITCDPAGNLYVGEGTGYVIRKISPERQVTTFAGTVGAYGYKEGLGTNCLLGNLESMVCDSIGNLYVADYHILRKITPAGNMTVVAGFYGREGYKDGEGISALFNGMTAITMDASGNIFTFDKYGNRIRKISYSPVPTVGFDITMFPGLAISGIIGNDYRIEYADSPAPTNGWKSATTLRLTSSPQLWFDASAAGRGSRFYRAIPLP